MNNKAFTQFCADKNIKLTDLRKDILSILFLKNKPLGAYEILTILKKKRQTAEPPTVYRVLDYLIEAGLIHKIESQNTYVCCAHSSEPAELHQAILFICKKCGTSWEFMDKTVLASLKKFSAKHAIAVDNTLIELKGICQLCL